MSPSETNWFHGTAESMGQLDEGFARAALFKIAHYISEGVQDGKTKTVCGSV